MYDKQLNLVVDMYGCPNRCLHCWIGHMPNRKMEDGADRLIAHEIRYIDVEKRVTRWKLEGSTDGKSWFMIEDKSAADTNLGNDFILPEGGVRARYLKLTVLEVPFDQPVAVSGLRVFGHGNEKPPQRPRA